MSQGLPASLKDTFRQGVHGLYHLLLEKFHLIYLREKGGEKPVPWSAVAPESIFAMAKSLVTPDENASQASFRKWHLGNFAAFIGKSEEARALLTEAAQANSQYEPDIAVILEIKATP